MAYSNTFIFLATCNNDINIDFSIGHKFYEIKLLNDFREKVIVELTVS